MNTRITYLDGLRGVAILMVLGFHAYARWPSIVPYGNQYQDFPLFTFGWLGVQLFFLISGFVIFMTLERSTDIWQFIFKRFVRLFPAMLLASLLLYFSVPLFPERPYGNPELISLLPGLTFIEPEWWTKLLGVPIRPLEGAFWSLYVEFKFYAFAGVIYFFLGKRFLAPGLFVLFLMSVVIEVLFENYDFQSLYLAKRVCDLLSLSYFGWFCSGATFYLYHQSKRERYFIAAIGVATLSSLLVGQLNAVLFALGLLVLFAASIRLLYVQKMLSWKPLLFLGFISYPLYLIHENLMISTIVKLDGVLHWLDPVYYPVLTVALLSFVAFFIASKLEPRAGQLLKHLNKSTLKQALIRISS